MPRLAPVRSSVDFRSAIALPSVPSDSTHETALARHRQRVVERAPRLVDQLVDLALADDQGWREGDDVAGHVAQDRAVRLSALDNKRANARLRVEARARLLVLDELQRADKADAARFADQRMLLQALQPCLQPRADLA